MEQHNNTTTRENVPHIRAVSLSMQAIQALIRQRLDWSEDKYSEFQMEAGFEFLNVIVKPLQDEGKSDVPALTYSSLFWGWWRNEWYKRDQSVYKWKTLNAANYEYLHTNDVIGCDETVSRFWSHKADFVKAGKDKMRKEAKNDAALH